MVRLLPDADEIPVGTLIQFQSHNGAIAAVGGLLCVWGNWMFQSHNGAIAALHPQPRAVRFVGVSIPQWCDCCAVE